MNKYLVMGSLCSIAFLLTGCGQPSGDASLSTTGAAPQPSGESAYEAACAACHDEGVDGAPRTGYPGDWEGRSRLWQAVLVEHANSGYLAMPAKGGDTTLSDATVAAAAEYMLELTHKDLPPDD